MTPELKKLIIWIARNNEAEPMSGMMPGGPVWHLHTVDLLDAIAEIYGITKEDVGAVVNAENERREMEYEAREKD